MSVIGIVEVYGRRWSTSCEDAGCGVERVHVRVPGVIAQGGRFDGCYSGSESGGGVVVVVGGGDGGWCGRWGVESEIGAIGSCEDAGAIGGIEWLLVVGLFFFLGLVFG